MMSPMFSRMVVCLWCVVPWFAVGAAGQTDQASVAKPDREIAWTRSLDAALEQARLRQVPVFVAVQNEMAARLSGESEVEINRLLVQEVYRDSGLVRVARSLVCLAASPDAHGAVLTETGAACPYFGGLVCPEHQAAAMAIRTRLYDGAELPAHEHLVLSPDGRLLARDRFVRTAAELAFFLDRAVDRFRHDLLERIVRDLCSSRTSTRSAALARALVFLEHDAASDDRASSRMHRAVVQYLERLKRDQDRRQAWDAIAEAGHEAALALLVPFLSARSPGLREEALDVLARAEPCAAFLPMLAARVRSERSAPCRLALIETLDRYADRMTEAYDALNRLVRAPGEAVQVAATLAAARPGNRALVPELIRRARAEANPRVRKAAILGLARMGAAGARSALEAARRKSGRRSTIRAPLDLALAVLAGDPEAARDLDEEVERLKAEAGLDGSGGDEARDRTDRKWRGAAGRS